MIQIHTLLSTIPLADSSASDNQGTHTMIMIGLMAVMFYFLLIRPQQRQRKEQLARIAALQAGDKVVTSSGIHGIIHNVKDHTATVKVAEGVMIEFDKLAIAIVHKKDSASK